MSIEIIPVINCPEVRIGKSLFYNPADKIDGDGCSGFEEIDAPAAVANFYDGILTIALGALDYDYRVYVHGIENFEEKVIGIDAFLPADAFEGLIYDDDGKVKDNYKNRKLVNDCIEVFNRVVSYTKKVANDYNFNEFIKNFYNEFKNITDFASGNLTCFIDENGEQVDIY